MGCCDQWVYAGDGMSLSYEDDQPLIEWYNLLLRLQEGGGMQSYEDFVARGDMGAEMSNYLGIIEMDNSPLCLADPAAYADVISNIFEPESVGPVM